MDHMTAMYAAATALAERKIVTSHVYPPIPCRDFDWCAHFDDVGADCSPYGWGRTEAEAKQDLLDNYGEDGPMGARCTAELKRKVRLGFQRPDDTVIIGYTAEEYATRHDRLEESEPLVNFWPILWERGITKEDCYGMVERAGIEIPTMYKLGYRNNNCIGCVKGQAGYWNKIRVDFPERFAEMAQIERELGRAICKREWVEDGVRKLERIPLDRLPPNLGNYGAEPDISCGIICQSASIDIEDCDAVEEAA